MKSNKKQIDKIEEALIAAYREQEDLQFPSDWRQRVMKDIHSMARPTPAPIGEPAKTRAPRRILYMAAGALATIVVWLVLANLDYYDPWITLKPVITIVEYRAEYLLEAGDEDSGLRNLQATVIQEGKEIKVLSHTFKPAEGFLGSKGATKKVEVSLVLDAEALNLRDGPATLKIATRDLSWRNSFQGRLTVLKKEIYINTKRSPRDRTRSPRSD
jgi:hypothetical protein